MFLSTASPRFQYYKQTMSDAIALTKTALKLWKNLFQKCWKLVTNNAFKYFRDDRQYTYWSVIVFRFACIFLENWSNRCQLQVIWELCTFQRIVKIFCYICRKKSLLSFKSFTGRPDSCIVFEQLRILISFATFAIVTELNVNLSRFSWTAVIANYTRMIPPFHNCFQSRMVHIIWQWVSIFWFR